MAMIVVNGVALPNPTSYKVKLSDLDSEATTRNTEGYLLRDRVRANVYRIDVAWIVTKSDYITIVEALAPEKFTVQFFDSSSATTKTAQMYASDRDGDLKAYLSESAPQSSLWELSCALIEY